MRCRRTGNWFSLNLCCGRSAAYPVVPGVAHDGLDAQFGGRRRQMLAAADSFCAEALCASVVTGRPLRRRYLEFVGAWDNGTSFDAPTGATYARAEALVRLDHT
jgi:hypothetical protein